MKRCTILLGALLILTGTALGAEEDEPLVKSPPFNNRAGLARAAYKAGDNARSIKLYTEALQFRSSIEARRRALIRRGNAYVDDNQPDKALTDFNEALRLGACESCICVDRAIAFDKKGKVKEALAQFTRAIQLEPDRIESYLDRGNIYFREDDFAKALADFSKAIEMAPKNADARMNRARVYVRLKQNTNALAELDLALQENPASVFAYINRAETHARMNDLPKAKEDLDSAVLWIDKTLPRDRPFALSSLAYFLATSPQDSLRNAKDALKFASEACELDHGRNYGFVATLAAAYAEAGDFDKAIKSERKALERMPPHQKSRDEEQAKLALYRNQKPYRDVIK